MAAYLRAGDREQLEIADARVLVFSYYKNKGVLGAEKAGKWLEKRLKKLEKVYGKGSSDRLRVYMRHVSDKDYFP